VDPPIRLAAFHASRLHGLTAREIRLKLFSPNPPHVDAQAVTII
jgi:hypothetical protein